MMRGIFATIIAVAVLAVGLVLLNGGAFNTPTPSPLLSPSIGPTPTPNRTPTSTPSASPSATPVDTSVVASGIVVPVRSADLATRLSGVVGAIYVHEGSEVAANQLLLKLDQATYTAAVNQAVDLVSRNAAAVEQAQLQVELLPTDASPGQIESVQANLRVAQAELELARSTLSSAQAELDQTEVRAPFEGTVAEVTVEVGEQAVAGQTVVTIGDLSSWLIETTDLSELEVVRLAVGDRATVGFDALPDLSVEGTVDRIQVRGTTADGGVVFAVAIRPDSNEPELRWGMSATVRIRPSG
jgi:RND family efflux transporter MFP subunit